MKILIADDDVISLRMLDGLLTGWGYQVVMATDGDAAWRVLQENEPPSLAILDWTMPGLYGIEICRRLRQKQTPKPTYVILVTARTAKADVVASLEAGANDYITKPFDNDELQARVRVGGIVTELQARLADRVRELEAASKEVKQLKELLPICSYCKKIRDDNNYWQKLEAYIGENSDVKFSHGICPDCWRDVVEPELRRAGLAPENHP